MLLPVLFFQCFCFGSILNNSRVNLTLVIHPWGFIRKICLGLFTNFLQMIESCCEEQAQESFLLLPLPEFCWRAMKSVMRWAAFRGRSITTEWPQLSNRSTWQPGKVSANKDAPDTSSTCTPYGRIMIRCQKLMDVYKNNLAWVPEITRPEHASNMRQQK